MHVEVVITNTDNSAYSEIALRSLLRSNPDLPPSRVTIADNHSRDDTRALRDCVEECGATWWRTRWPAHPPAINSQGDVLRDFVLSKPDCDAHLLLHSDVWFFQADPVRRMAEELAADDSLWAVQARFSSDGRTEIEDGSLLKLQRRVVHLVAAELRSRPQTPTLELPTERAHAGMYLPGAHTACLLVRNADPLRALAKKIGLSCAWIWSRELGIGGFYDTLTLVTQIMAALGHRYALSDVLVGHFRDTTMDSAGQAASKRGACEEMLASLRRETAHR
jgi:hypothetical protein